MWDEAVVDQLSKLSSSYATAAPRGVDVFFSTRFFGNLLDSFPTPL